MSSAAASETPSADRGTLVQRVRAALIAAAARVLTALPDAPVDALGDTLGELWYRVDKDRASLGRRNLERVVRSLADRGLGGRRVATAAVDGHALEQLLRATFRHAARYYLDMARLPAQDPADIDRRLKVETPGIVERAFSTDLPMILVAMHFGAIEYPARFAVARAGPIVTPMETLDDPALQGWIRRTRAAAGVDIVGLRDARHALFDALSSGRSVGLVADRHVAGGSVEVPFFGVPAPLPPGPGFLAVETGRPIYLGAVRRLGRGRYAGALYAVPTAQDGDRRTRIAATTASIATAMEQAIAVAPEQWWSLLAPIWPDIDRRAIHGTGRIESTPADGGEDGRP